MTVNGDAMSRGSALDRTSPSPDQPAKHPAGTRTAADRQPQIPAAQVRPALEERAAAPRPRATQQPEGETGGPKGPEPTRYGDWEKGGRCFDF